MNRPAAVALGVAMGIGASAPLYAQSTLDWRRIAQVIVARADIGPGENVMMLGVPGRFDPLVAELEALIRDRGATYLGTIAVSTQPFIGSEEEVSVRAHNAARAALVPVFRDVDVAVMLPGATVANAEYAAMQDVLRSGRGRTIHFHWIGAYDPSGRELPVTDAIDRFYQQALLDTDYDALARVQLAFEQAAREGEIRVTTPAGTDIRFRIGDRPVSRQDGDATAARARDARNLIDREIELPAGAIRVAPIEESVNGVIVIPVSEWSGSTARNVSLRFESGRVVEVNAATGVDAIEAEMAAAGAAARAFREFALGFNPLLALPQQNPWIPYYGYGAGVVRLSLGDNSELGGNVTGGYVRWNFFPDASVWVNGTQWVRDGALLGPSPR